MGITNTVLKLKNYFDAWHSATEHSADSLVNKKSLFDEIYPIGSIYMTTSSSFNPNNSNNNFNGNWIKIEGRFLVGASNSDNDFTIGTKKGDKTQTLLIRNLPAHNHGLPAHTHRASDNKQFLTSNDNIIVDQTSRVYASKASSSTFWYVYSKGGKSGINQVEETAGWIGVTDSAGADTPFSILPPYEAVYIWKRIG